MNRSSLISSVSMLSLASLLGLGCAHASAPSEPCRAPVAVDDGARLPVVIHLEPRWGDRALQIGSVTRTSSGAEVKIKKLRFYLSEGTLVETSGRAVDAPLAGRDGKRLPYGVTLVDAAAPETLELRVLALPGSYKALNLTVGVPDRAPDCEELNHGDASTKPAPLDVDSDMYWSWNPGYVFLKVEGQVRVGGSLEPFLYHVGEDRRAKLHVHVPLEVASDHASSATLVVDASRLFVTPEGESKPRLEAAERSHGGATADRIVANMTGSRFLTVAASKVSP